MPGGIAAAAVVGAGASMYGANKAKQGASQANQLSREQYQQGIETTAPFRQVGIEAIPQLQAMAKQPQGQFAYRDPGAFLSQYFQGPEFAALNKQAQDTILRNQAATGGFRSGGTQAGLAQIAPTLGIQALQRQNAQDLTAYGTNQAAFSDQYNRLFGLTNLGANISTGNANAGANYASQAGQNAIAAGNAAAQGAYGVGQAIQGGLGDYMGLQLYKQNQANAQRPGLDYNQRLV